MSAPDSFGLPAMACNKPSMRKIGAIPATKWRSEALRSTAILKSSSIDAAVGIVIHIFYLSAYSIHQARPDSKPGVADETGTKTASRGDRGAELRMLWRAVYSQFFAGGPCSAAGAGAARVLEPSPCARSSSPR